MDKVYKHPRLGDVLLRQRWTTSRISLSVRPSGEVRLSYPRLVSTAKAFAYALSKKVLGVTSFESLAYNIVDKVKKLTVIDARHDNFYVCGFDENNSVIVEPCFKTKQEII